MAIDIPTPICPYDRNQCVLAEMHTPLKEGGPAFMGIIKVCQLCTLHKILKAIALLRYTR